MTNCKVENFPRSMWRQLAIAGNIELRVLGDKFKTEGWGHEQPSHGTYVCLFDFIAQYPPRK